MTDDLGHKGVPGCAYHHAGKPLPWCGFHGTTDLPCIIADNLRMRPGPNFLGRDGPAVYHTTDFNTAVGYAGVSTWAGRPWKCVLELEVTISLHTRDKSDAL